MHEVIDIYIKNDFWLVLLAFCSIYINFVSFAIPGTSVLAILSGPVFGLYLGFFLVHMCSITGACVSYFMSMRFGAGVLQSKFPEKFAWFKAKIDENRHNIFYYFLFLRFAPVAPNLFINMASGIVGVPFHIFLLGSLIGQIPFTFLYLKAGMMLD